jgi:hypothetical protein
MHGAGVDAVNASVPPFGKIAQRAANDWLVWPHDRLGCAGRMPSGNADSSFARYGRSLEIARD